MTERFKNLDVFDKIINLNQRILHGCINAQKRVSKKYPYPRNNHRRGFLRSGIALAAGLVLDYKLEGIENLPKEGPLLIVANHFHFLDTIGPIHATRYSLELISDSEMPNAPGIFKVLPAIWGTLPITQGKANLEAIRAAEAILEQKGVLAIFPEGHVHKPPLAGPSSRGSL